MYGPLPCLFSSVKVQRAAPEFNWKCSCHATCLHPRLAFGVGCGGEGEEEGSFLPSVTLCVAKSVPFGNDKKVNENLRRQAERDGQTFAICNFLALFLQQKKFKCQNLPFVF